MLVLDGEEHLRMRRLLLPSFHGDAVHAYTDLIGGLAASEVERWLGSRLPWIAARREADGLLFAEIADHRATPQGREDILAMLIAAGDEDQAPLSDQELRDQVMTLLVAGHETTSTTLAWCFERLQRHPRCLERLQDEITSGGSDVYLDAVINETFRTRPVADQVVRTLTVPTEMAGYTLPAGTTVAASILGVQLSDVYENPEEFYPERFVDQPPPPYALIPFGGGVRRCAGASFAVTEIKTILRTTFERVRLRATREKPERPVRWRRFTVTPARGGRVTVDAPAGMS